ncbi:LamG-like jellyroll fold domain-containing protein [Synechococcus sp. UW140]|uniref:LamG-like jellyroll fold domain-containing protein n=1 Tax=Synechococcus sp. UW140 TaxID=368503 RepID=UPI003137C981
MWRSDGKWDDTNNKKNYITEYGWSGPQFTVGLTGTPINGIENSNASRFTITANKYVPNDYYDVRNTDGNTNALINIPLTFGGTATLGVDYTVSYSNGLGGNGSNAYIKDGSSVDVIITAINDSIWESTKDVTVAISDNDTNNDTYAIAEGATTFQRAILSDDEPVLTMGNSLRKSIYFPYNDSAVSLDNLTAAYSTFDASINEYTDNFAAEGLIDNFAIRWQGYVKIETTGQYIFTPRGDDGLRLKVNGSQVINQWQVQGATSFSSAPIQLTAGSWVPLQLDYYQGNGGKEASLSWTRPNPNGGAAITELIPSSSFAPYLPTQLTGSVSEGPNGGADTIAQGFTIYSNKNINNTLDVKVAAASTGGASYSSQSAQMATFNNASRSALQLNGSTYLNVGNPSKLQLTAGTVEAWIKTSDAGSGDRNIFCKGECFELKLVNNKLTLYNFQGGVQTIVQPDLYLNDNRWHHVALAFGSGTASVYVDGKQVGSNSYTYSSPNPTANNVTIGGWSNYSQPTNAAIDEVRIWNRKLSGDEIKNYNTYPLDQGNLPSGLVAYFPMDEGSGSTVVDKTANPTNASIIGTANWAGPVQASANNQGFAQLGGSTSRVGDNYMVFANQNDANNKANPLGGTGISTVSITTAAQSGQNFLSLNGNNQYATLPQQSLGGPLTIESWVKLNSYSNWARIIDFGNGAGNQNILLGQLASTGRLVFHVYDGSGNRIVDLEPLTQIPLNEWTHVAATIDPQKNVKLYMNGAVIGTTVASSLPTTMQRTNNYVGRSNWGGDNAYLNGSIDELRIYNTARSADTISNDRYNTANPGDSTLVYAYSFNSASSNQSPSSLTGASGASLVNGASISSSAAVDGSPAANNLWLRVLGDPYAKPNQQIQLDLVDNAYGITTDGYTVVGSPNSLTINDSAPVVSILSKVDPTEGSLGYVDLSFDKPVTSAAGLKVKYTLSGNATAGQDYLYPTARLNTDPNSANYQAQNIVYFAAGSTGGRIYLPGVQDAVAEGLESIQLTLVDNIETNSNAFTYTGYSVAANASQTTLNLKDSGYYASGVAITAQGKTGTAALRFNGSADRLRTSISEAATSTSREIVFRTTSANGGLYQLDVNATNNYLGLYLQNGNLVSKLGANSLLTTTNSNYADGNWHRVLVTVGSNGGHCLYVDGRLVASSSTQTSATGGPFTSSFVGYNGNGGSTGSYFNGDIRSLRNWDQELTSNHATGLPTTLPAATNWLDFNSNRIVDYTAATGSLASALTLEGSLQTVTTTQVRATSNNTAALQLKLTSQPTDAVTMVITATNASVASGASLTFTASNWDTAQTVNLTGISSSQLATITASASSSDSNYNRSSTLTVLPFGWSGSQQLDLVEGGPVVAIVPIASISATNNSVEGPTKADKSGFDIVFTDPVSAGGGELLFTLNQGLTGNGIAKVESKASGALLSGGILKLDSSANGYATLPSKSIGGALTIESWVKLNSYTNWSRIIDFGNGAGNQNILLGQLESTGRLVFHVYDGSGNRIVDLEPLTQIPLNEWTHVAATIDPQKNVKLYMNGAVIGTTVATSLPTTMQRTNNYVGRSNWGGDAYLNGSLSDLRVYSGARTAEQINQDRYSAVDASDISLTYAYTFNNTANSSLAGSGNGAPTLFGGASLISGADIDINVDHTYRPLNFNGINNQYLDLPNKTIGGDLSIEAWVNLSAYASNGTIVDIGSGSTTDNISLGFDGTTGSPVFRIFNGSTKILELKANTSYVPINQWSHVAATIDNNRLATLYINGVAVGSATASAAASSLLRNETRIGNTVASSAPLNGSLRDINIYDVCRSSAQIKEDLYTSPSQSLSTGNNPNLLWSYALNNSTTSRFSSTSTGETLVNGNFATTPIYGLMLEEGAQSTSIALTSVDNNIAQGDRTVQINVLPSAGYGISTTSTSTFTLSDNDSAGLDLAILVNNQTVSNGDATWSPLSDGNYKITVSEADRQGTSITTRHTIGVRLKSQPLATVLVQTPASTSTAIDVYNAGTTTPFSGLTFTPGDWSTYKMIDIVGRDDGQAAGDRTTNLSFSLANSSDTTYQTITSAVDVLTSNADTLVINSGMAAEPDSTGTVAFLSTTAGGSIGELGSLVLDGSSTGYATLPSRAIGGALTIESWVNVKQYTNWASILDLGNGAGVSQIILMLHGDTGKPRFMLQDAAGNSLLDVISSVPLQLNEWSHVSATIDDNKLATIYVNGVSVATGTASALPQNLTRSNNYIGKANKTWHDNLNGSIRDLRLYSGSRSQSQIIADSQSAVNPADANLTYAYGFNGTANSSRTGDAAATQFSGASLRGEGSSGLNFSGSTAQYASLTPKTLGGPLTMEAWVNVKQYTNWPSIIDLGNGANQSQIVLMLDGITGKPRFQLQDAAGNGLTSYMVSNEPLPLNQWSHLAVTIDANKLATLYVNGVSVASQTTTALPETLTRTSNLIGKANKSWHDNFNGTIRDVRVYSAARSVEQINADRFNAISADDTLVYGYELKDSATSATNSSEVATIVGSSFGASSGNTGSQNFTVSLKQARSTDTQVYFQLDGSSKERVGSDLIINESSRSTAKGLNEFIFDNYIQQTSSDQLQASSFSRRQVDNNGINETYASTYANASSPLKYALRWTGFVYIPTDGYYAFKSKSDSGVRLTINNQLLIDRWHSVATSTSNPSTTYIADELYLKAGTYVPIVYDYFDSNTASTNTSIAQLWWQRPNPSGVGTTDELIPANHFSVNGLDSVLIPANSTSASFNVNTVDNIVAQKIEQLNFSLLSNPGIKIKAGTYTQTGGQTTIKLKLDGAYQDSLALSSGTTLDFCVDDGQSIGSVVNSLTLTSDVTLFNGFEVGVTGTHANANAFTTSMAAAYRPVTYRPNLNVVATSDFTNTGLTRQLFAGYTDLTRGLYALVPTATATDSNGINETDASFAPLTSTDNFAARWTGYIKIPSTGSYSFRTVTDKGVRLYIDGQALINQWTASSQGTFDSTSQSYTQGQLVAVTMDYFTTTGASTAQLQWSYGGVNNQVIPASAFSQLGGSIGLRLNESDTSLTRSLKAGDSLQFSNGTSLRVNSDVTLSTTATAVSASISAITPEATVSSGETLSLTAAPAAQLTVIDNDRAGFRITSDSAGLQSVLATDTFSINEADSNGAGLTRYLALTTQPTKTVTVYLESAATNHALLKGGSSSQAQKRIPLTFTPSNWYTPQAFSVIPQRDQIATGNVNVGIFATATSDDLFYNNLRPGNNGKVFNISKVDMDVPAIITSAVSVATGEGSNSNGSFTVSLSTKPTANVNVTLNPTDGQFTVNNASINNDQVLVFTPTNWNIPQQVQVQAVANNIVQDTTISHLQLKSSSSDANYTNLTTPDVSVLITHNTLPTVRLELVALSEATAENGKPASWRLVSNAPVPTSWGSTGLVVGYGVTNVLSSANLDGNSTESVSINTLVQGLNSSGTIRIAPGQTTSNAFIMPIDDFTVDGVDKTFQLNLQTGSGYTLDPSASTATITIKDDDVAGIMIVQAGERTMAVERATASQFQVCLLSQPTSTVTIQLSDISTVAAGQSGTPIRQLTVNNPTLTFTKDNWNVLQVVNIAANDDNRIEDGTGTRLNTGIHTGQIQYAFTSNDSNYSSAGKAANHFTNTTQAIDILDRPLDPATYQGLDQALTALMDGLNALSLPMVGNLEGKVGLGFNKFLDKLIDSIRTAPQLTSKKLEKLLMDSIGVDIDVDMTMNSEGLAITFGIEDQYDLYSIPLAADFGIPAFGFQTNGAIDGTFDYSAVLAMGIDINNGFYLDIENTTFEANYITGLSDDFSLTGGLGYLQLDAVNKPSPHTDSNGDPVDGLTDESTGMNANFTLTLSSPYEDDETGPFTDASKVDVPKLLSTDFSDLFEYSFTGDAALSLGVTTSAGGSSVIPSFSFDLSSIMPLFDYTNKPEEPEEPEQPNQQEEESNIFFDNIELDMGSFVTGFIRPSIAAIDGILKPIYPIINALYADTYVFSKLGIAGVFDDNNDGKASTIELAQFTADLIAKLSPGNPKALELVQSIEDTIAFCDTLKGVIDLMGELNSMSKDESFTIDFGSYTLPNFKASSDNPADSASNKNVDNQAGTLASSQSTSAAASSKTGRGAKLSKAFNDLKDLGFSIPLIENPANIIKLLFGQNVDLFTWQLPDTGLSSSVEKVFPIYGALYGVMRGGYGMSTDLSFGFDTAGIQQWSRDGFKLQDSYKALDGFYIATGSPQLTFEALMEAGLGVGGNGIRADITGGLLGTAEFELLDPGGVSGTSDGKLRGSEIAANITTPLNLFQLTGQIAAVLNTTVQVGIDAGAYTYWATVWRQRLATIPIFKFGIGGSYGSGQASNSYLQGSTVFFDANFNGIIDPGEPTAITSQEDGSYSLEIDNRTFDTNQNGTIEAEEGMLVVYGGVDSVSQAPIRTPFVAPYGAMVTPLTSLYAYSLIIAKDKPGFSEDALKSKIQQFFLLGNYDFLNRDPEGDLLQAESADGNTSFFLTPEQKVTAENAYMAHIKLHLAAYYLETLGENVLPNIFPNDLPNKLRLNKELYSQIIAFIEASDAQDPTGSKLSISTVNAIFPAIADGMIAYISQATTDQRSIATFKSLFANIVSRSTLAFNELDEISKAYNGKEFFDKINEIKAKIFNGITSEMESTVNFYQSIPGTPTMSNGARIDPSNPISFKPSNAIAPDPTITKTNVKLNDTMIDFTAILEGIGKRTSLGLNLKVVGDSLLSKLDPNRTGIQVPNKQLAYFAIDAAGNTTPFTYSPNNDVGARFYDLNGFGMPDFVHLSYVDGGPGDMDGVKDGKISDPSSAAVVDSTPSLHLLGTNALQIGDLSINVPTALFISLTLKSNSSDLNHVGYLVLNQDEDPSSVTLGDLLNNGQILFSSLGKSSSLPMGETLFSRNLQITNNQKLLCFETKGATLQDLALGKSSLAELGSQFQFLTWNTLEGSKIANVNSTSGISIELNLKNSAPGLNALISSDQSFAPVLNTTALAGAQLTGSLTYNREANYDSTVGFYQVLDQNGSLFDSITGQTLDPTNLRATDQARYRELALSDANRATSLAGITTTNGQLAQKDFSLTAGSFYAPFAVVANTEQTYFAFAAVNTDGVNHFKMMGSNTFGLEDLHGGGDRDYNDLLVGINFKNYVPV